jgi:uncharacterized protein (TIGR00375 family)
MSIIADLQIHSKYSRAVSPEMVLPKITQSAEKKGIDLIATGDWTHPLWFREIKMYLEETGSGVLKLKNSPSNVRFLLATEVSSIYSQDGKVRRIHTLIWVPTLSSVEKINTAFVKRGANLMSDGRPIVGIPARDVAAMILAIEPSALIIPAHVWTPWFALYGSQSGFDSIDECFGDYSKYVYAIETGLSSDPAMNWRISELDHRSILSFSDAHSGPKLGREATVFSHKTKDTKFISFSDLSKAIKQDNTGDFEVSYTIEFYPEEGKYHYTGHRNCQIRQSPEETKKLGTTCSVCGRGLTVGVMHRVEQIASRPPVKVESKFIPKSNLRMIYNADVSRPPYAMLVPLSEILAESLGSLVQSDKVKLEYERLVKEFGSEFSVLLSTPIDQIKKFSGERIGEGIERVRKGDIVIEPGYDGVFGVVKIWNENKKVSDSVIIDQKEQLTLF